MLLVDKTFSNLQKSKFTFKDGKKKKSKKKKSSEPTNDEWMTQNPRQNEGTEKSVSGQRYFWCGRCGNWNTSHKVGKCGKDKPKRTKKENDGSTSDDADAPAEVNFVELSPEGDGWMFSPGYDQL